MTQAGAGLPRTPARGRPDSARHVPPGDARGGGLVRLNAICGLTPHIRALSEELAGHGYEVIAPSLLDPAEAAFPDQDLDPPRLAERMALGEASGWGQAALPRVQAAIDALQGPVSLMGFCFGGTTAWLAACRCSGLSAVSSFYGGDIIRFIDETPQVPTALHFGKTDSLIPLADVAAIGAAHPDLPVWLYEAGHAFVAPSGHHADSARLAMLRTLQLFQRAGGRKGEA